MMRVPEKYRLTGGMFPSSKADGNNGYFQIPFVDGQILRTPRLFMARERRERAKIMVIVASDGEGWEHVSCSFGDRTPTWEEMCQVKDLFWGKEDCVLQFHPPKSEYVNMHNYTLHLWRPAGKNPETPPSILVGF